MIKGPFFKHFGSKWTLSKYYPQPLFDTIIETHAGSAGYACLHSEGRAVVLSEVDPETARTWQWLIERANLGGLPENMPFDLTVGDDLREAVGAAFGMGAADFVRRWQRVGRTTCWTVSKWGTGSHPGMWTPQTWERINVQLPAIRDWLVFPGSYRDLPDIHDATYFVDPLYKGFPKVYPNCPPEDYEFLAQWCLTRRGQVIVCEQEGADWLPFHELKRCIGGARCHGSKHYTEVYCHILNGKVWP